MEEQTTFTFRLEKSLKDEFEHIAKAYDQTASQMLRSYMRQQIAEYQRTHPAPTKPGEKAK